LRAVSGHAVPWDGSCGATAPAFANPRRLVTQLHWRPCAVAFLRVPSGIMLKRPVPCASVLSRPHAGICLYVTYSCVPGFPTDINDVVQGNTAGRRRPTASASPHTACTTCPPQVSCVGHHPPRAFTVASTQRPLSPTELGRLGGNRLRTCGMGFEAGRYTDIAGHSPS